LLNIVSFFINEEWHVFVIPRKKHRPDQFFAEDESKILISPASVDMAGLCITPREDDFKKLCEDDIINIYHQVLLGDELLTSLKNIF